MKKKISLKFLEDFINSDELQKKFLDFENNKYIFNKLTKEDYYNEFINYYVSVLEEELYEININEDAFDMERFKTFYKNMIINYTDNFPYYLNNNLINCFNRLLPIDSKSNLSFIDSECFSYIYKEIIKHVTSLGIDISEKYKTFKSKMNQSEFEYISKKYLYLYDRSEFAYSLINEIIEKGYEVQQPVYLEIFNGFMKNEIKRLGLDNELGFAISPYDEDSTEHATFKQCGLIKVNIKYLKSKNVINNMLTFYHELSHFLRDKEYLNDEDKLTLEIKKEEILIEHCDNYYKDNYFNTYCEEEARFMSYKFLMEYIKNNVPCKTYEVIKFINKEIDNENTIDDSSDARRINNRIKPFDLVFDEFVKNNFYSIFHYEEVEDDEQVLDYILKTYDCFGDRRGIDNMKQNNNLIGASEKTSKKELLKYLINFHNIHDSFYKEKLNDFFTQYIRMYYSYLINNLWLKQNDNTKKIYMNQIENDSKYIDKTHVKKLSKKSNDFIR